MLAPSPGETVILLAEDDAVVRNLVRTMLTKEGYVVIAAKDGAEALQLCEAYSHTIHLLLTDVMMPRMNGWDLADAVRVRKHGIRVIAMSGYTVDAIRTGNKPDALLRKPFIPPTLLKCIQKVLASEGPVDCEQ